MLSATTLKSLTLAARLGDVHDNQLASRFRSRCWLDCLLSRSVQTIRIAITLSGGGTALTTLALTTSERQTVVVDGSRWLGQCCSSNIFASSDRRSARKLALRAALMGLVRFVTVLQSPREVSQ